MNNKKMKLSATVRKTLILICSNLCAKQIAEKRCLAFETIQGHFKAIRKATGSNLMATAVFRIMAAGLLTDAEVQQALNAGN
ncbi:MAG: hypothetical protein POELPBGB_02147 [Bacteroidia bacterium]|nr:hypothetical protein [Bacteroidia bacterium]